MRSGSQGDRPVGAPARNVSVNGLQSWPITLMFFFLVFVWLGLRREERMIGQNGSQGEGAGGGGHVQTENEAF